MGQSRMDIPGTQTILDTIHKKQNAIMRNTDHIIKNRKKGRLWRDWWTQVFIMVQQLLFLFIRPHRVTQSWSNAVKVLYM